MKFNLLKTRRGRLRVSLKEILGTSLTTEKLEQVLNVVDDYENDNLETIAKLKRSKTVELNKINGALKQTINTHGPITKILIGSATKRIYGALLDNHNKKISFIQKIINIFKNE